MLQISFYDLTAGQVGIKTADINCNKLYERL